MEKLLKISIERNIHLNAVDHHGSTPFHLMCMTRCSTETSTFLELARKYNFTVDTKKRDFDGKTPQDLAIQRKRYKESRNGAL